MQDSENQGFAKRGAEKLARSRGLFDRRQTTKHDELVVRDGKVCEACDAGFCLIRPDGCIPRLRPR